MYRINDKISAVKAVQRMLGESETGIYNAKLREKITQFQKNNGLDSSGKVDYVTFKSLIVHYNKRMIMSELKASLPFLNRFPYKLGDMGHDVLYINTLLSDTIVKYRLAINKPRGTYYGTETVYAVRYLREATNTGSSDNIDEEFIYTILGFK